MELDSKTAFIQQLQAFHKREREHEKERYTKTLVKIAAQEQTDLTRIEEFYPRLLALQKQLETTKRTLGTMWPHLYEGKGYEVTKLEIVYMSGRGFFIEGKMKYPKIKDGIIESYVSGPCEWNLQGHYLGGFSRSFDFPKNLPIGENFHWQAECQ